MSISRLYCYAAVSFAAVAFAAASAAPASAQAYPTRPITLVVGFAAGGFADGIARLIGQKLGESLGQAVVVENRPGAGGNIAAKSVLGTAPDGYTVLVTTTALAINETLHKDRGFSAADLTAVAIVGTSPEMLSVGPKSPYKTLADLVRHAREKSIDFGSAGVGTGSHISAEYFFRDIAKVKALHVPFKGGAPAVTAAMGGHIEVLSATLAGKAAQIREGSLRGIAVASAKRVGIAPDVPTFAESGYPGFQAASWVGFFVPAKTGGDVVARLNKAVNDALRQPDVLERLKAFTVDPRHDDPAGAAAYYKSEIASWSKMVTAVGLAGK